jgi:peptidoglycan/LPS O-acetylase OafA/YrhL
MMARLDEHEVLFIDALRGVLALGVLITHSIDLGIAGVYGWDLTANAHPWNLLRVVAGHGGAFVWGFFVISGVCIQQSILRSFDAGSFTISSYLLGRFSRIYPLFLLGFTLAIAAWLIVHQFRLDGFPWAKFFATLLSLHALTTSFPMYEPSWSLSNEMVYYVLWPLGLLLTGNSSNLAARVTMTATIAVALALLVLWGLHPATASSTALNGIWCLVILFPLWIAGAWLMTNWARVRDFVSFRLWLLGLLLSLVSMGLLAIARYHVLSPNITYALGLPALPGWLLIVAGGRHLQLGARIEWRPLWRWLGLLSFPCYILHYPILSFIHHWLGPDRSLVALQNPWLRSLILLAPTFVLVALVGPPLERRLLAWRARRIQSNNSVPAQAQSIPGDVP